MFRLCGLHDIPGHCGSGDEASVRDGGDVLVDRLRHQYLRLLGQHWLGRVVVGVGLAHGGHVLVVALNCGGGGHRHLLVTVSVLLK